MTRSEMSLNTAIEIPLKRADGGFLNDMKYVLIIPTADFVQIFSFSMGNEREFCLY